jgi:hypothetical protein
VYFVTAKNKFMKKTIQIDLEEKQIEISRLPVFEYAELLRLLKELPKYLDTLSNQPPTSIIQQLPELISTSLPDVIAIVVFATQKQVSKEEVEQMGLNDLTNIVLGIIEVNDYTKIFDRLKKVMARQTE